MRLWIAAVIVCAVALGAWAVFRLGALGSDRVELCAAATQSKDSLPNQELAIEAPAETRVALDSSAGVPAEQPSQVVAEPQDTIGGSPRAAHALNVRILAPDGSPVAHANIDAWYSRSAVRAPGSWGPVSGQARTDPGGRACFTPAAFSEITEIHVCARSGELAGGLLVRAPFDGEERTLALAPAAWIDVLVQDELGVPFVGATAGAGTLVELKPCFAIWKRTGPDGHVRLGPFHAGPHELVAGRPFERRTVTQQVELAAGRVMSAVVALEPSTVRLAAAGHFVRAQDGTFVDASSTVCYRVDGGSWSMVDCRDDGSFEIWSAPGQEIELRIPFRELYGCGTREGTACEPTNQRVPFGTTGLAFRVLSRTAGHAWRLEVRDRASGEPIRHSHIFLTGYEDDREMGDDKELWNGEPMPVSLQGREVWAVASAAGYRECVKRLPQRDLPSDATSTLILELDRGMTRHVRIQVERDVRDIPGARLRIGSTVLAVADAGGRADFELGYAPESITIEADGYETKEWDPRTESASAERESVFLSPLTPKDG